MLLFLILIRFGRGRLFLPAVIVIGLPGIGFAAAVIAPGIYFLTDRFAILVALNMFFSLLYVLKPLLIGGAMVVWIIRGVVVMMIMATVKVSGTVSIGLPRIVEMAIATP